MKIIDNKKDYYDYLMGVYGIDEKIVYDRRNSITKEYFFKSNYYNGYDGKRTPFDDAYRMVLRVGNIKYVFLCNKNTNFKWEMPKVIREGYRGYSHQIEVLTNPRRIDDDELEHWKYNDCPLVLIIFYLNGKMSWYDKGEIIIKNPILSTFGVIPKFISANEIWENIYDFISHKYDKKLIDNRTDIEKLESHGFDKKSSFRNIK